MAVDNRTANRSYPLPDPTNNLDEDVYRLADAFNAIDGDMEAILDTLPQKSNVGHGHQIADVSGLKSALDGKAVAGHTHALDDLSDVSVSGAANGQFLKRAGDGWLPANPKIDDITSLPDALNARAMLDGKSVAVPAGTSSERPPSPSGPRFRFNTTLGEFEGWNGTEWGLIGGGGEALRDTFTYTATGGETTIPVSGYYAPDQGIVFLNGVMMDPFVDVDISSGQNIVFASPLAAGDAVIFIRFRAFDVATAVLFVSQILSEGQKAQTRQNIGLKDAATRDVGTTAGTVAAGDDGRFSDAREWTASVVSQAEAEAGISTTPRKWDALRVAQAIDALAPKSPVGLYTGTNAAETNFPIGHHVVSAGQGTRNSTISIRIGTIDSNYMASGTGAALSGTWRCRGQIGQGETLAQRVA